MAHTVLGANDALAPQSRARNLASFPGAANDKTICRYDGFVRDLRSGQLFKGVTYKLYKSDGSQTTRDDPYLIVDGGYHKWKELQAVMKGLSEPSEVACSHLRRL